MIKGSELDRKKVGILRPKGQASQLGSVIRDLGGIPVVAPAIDVRVSYNHNQVNDFLTNLAESTIDYVVFTSVNGVKALLRIASKLQQLKELMQGIRKVKIIAIGPKTAEEVGHTGVGVWATPKEYSTEGLLDLFGRMDMREGRVYLIRANNTGNLLVEGLRSMGAIASQVSVYETRHRDDRVIRNLIGMIRRRELDVILFTSSSSVTSLTESASKMNIGNLASFLNDFVIVGSIGPVTSNALRDAGISVDVESRTYVVEDLVEAVIRYMGDS